MKTPDTLWAYFDTEKEYNVYVIFSGWAGMIGIYKIRIDKKCNVFFQKQNGESNTDPAIILRRLHNLSAR